MPLYFPAMGCHCCQCVNKGLAFFRAIGGFSEERVNICNKPHLWYFARRKGVAILYKSSLKTRNSVIISYVSCPQSNFKRKCCQFCSFEIYYTPIEVCCKTEGTRKISTHIICEFFLRIFEFLVHSQVLLIWQSVRT